MPLIRTPLGVWVIDLLATGGDVCQRRASELGVAGDGDALRIGSFTFIVRYETPPAGSAAMMFRSIRG